MHRPLELAVTYLRPRSTLYRREQLPDELQGRVDKSEMARLLADESVDLEIKGSISLDVDRWFKGDKKKEKRESLPFESLVRTVTGFLNASGGNLVIGVLEAPRYENVAAAANLARHGEYLLLGVEDDFFGKDWDQYNRFTQDELLARIRPAPAGAFHINKVAIGEGRHLMVITVMPLRHTWYYAIEPSTNRFHFYVRLGAETRSLEGSDADFYKQLPQHARSVNGITAGSSSEHDITYE
jgi:Putative DNA-binding domain